MEHIIVVLPVNDAQKRKLTAAAGGNPIVFAAPDTADPRDVQDATIIIGNIAKTLCPLASRLKWMQLNSAGHFGYLHSGVIREGALLTNASGSYGPAISEHMLAVLLMHYKNLDHYYENQKAHIWQDAGDVKGIGGGKTLVVGLGDIGGAFAKKMHALGSTVYGIRRHKTAVPSYLSGLYTLDALDALLPQMDIVALTLPGYHLTEGLFTRERLFAMKPGASLINVGRGSLVDGDALYEALACGHLGAAMLDVTMPEPLPPSHKLWDVKNCYITPHISGGYHLAETLDHIVDIAAQNLRAFLCGQPLQNQVDAETGYRVYDPQIHA